MAATVYCNTCLSRMPVPCDAEFQCTNPACPIPYRFHRYDSLEDARKAYLEIDSWMAKFYFQPTADENASPENIWCIAWYNDPIAPFAPGAISELIEPDVVRLMEVGVGRDLNGPLSVIEPTGKRIEQLDRETPYLCRPCCQRIRDERTSVFDGNHECVSFDMEIIRRLKRTEPPDRLVAVQDFFYHDTVFHVFAYFCWAGFLDYVCPIVIQGSLVAVLFGGQHRFLEVAPSGLSGPEVLESGLRAAAAKSGIGLGTLQAAAAKHNAVSLEELRDSVLPSFFGAVRRVFDISFERYRQKREEKEHYFREEVVHHVESQRETRFGVKIVDKALARLRVFFPLKQAYFLLNDIHELDTYEIVAKATVGPLTASESSLRIVLRTEKLSIRDRISVFQLTGKDKYEEVVSTLRSHLGVQEPGTIWAATCPLTGPTSGFWLFLDPLPRPRDSALIGPDPVGQALPHALCCEPS